MESLAFFETMLRGGAAAIALLAAILSARAKNGFGVERLGAVFLLGTAAYALVSSPGYGDHFAALRWLLIFLATLNSVFFWWFATALFDDAFKWRPYRFAPLGVVIILFFMRRLDVLAEASALIHQAIVIALLVHVLWLALAHRGDDLSERRRAFRLVFAAFAGVLGLSFELGDMLARGGAPMDVLTLLHAAALFALVFGLSAWALSPLSVLERALPPRAAADEAAPPEDRADLARLSGLLDDGAYREENLSIGRLAARLGLPEHRLRKLINQRLGFRNFSAFLNARRIADAQAILSDPGQARRRITQIALDLGYGSIGPFNRAFKAATGTTPTEYRRAALSDQADRGG